MTIARCADGRMSRTNAAERSAWVQKLRRSGQSPELFAEEQGLRLSTLRRWMAMNQAHSMRVSFKELRLPAGAPMVQGDGWDCELCLPSGVVIRGRGAWIRDRASSLLEGVVP